LFSSPNFRIPIEISFKNNYLTERCNGSEAGSYLRLIDEGTAAHDRAWHPSDVRHFANLLGVYRYMGAEAATQRLTCALHPTPYTLKEQRTTAPGTPATSATSRTCTGLVGEVTRGEKMLLSGTDPESYIIEYTLVYEEKQSLCIGGRQGSELHLEARNWGSEVR